MVSHTINEEIKEETSMCVHMNKSHIVVFLLSLRSPGGTAQEKCTFSLCLAVCVSPDDALPSPNLKAPKDHEATGVTDRLQQPCQESLHWTMKVLQGPQRACRKSDRAVQRG